MNRLLFAVVTATFLAGLFIGVTPTTAKATTFSVDPIIVTLQRSNSSASIAITNQTSQKLRLQITGFAWAQGTNGQIKLSKTDDLIYFPQLLSLAAGETKRVRVGVIASQGSIEQTYRIFMEELPSLQSVIAPKGRSQVTLLLKIGIPVFLRPMRPLAASGTVHNESIRKVNGKNSDILAFDISNTGNVHFSIQNALVSGMNASGVKEISQNLSGWYVLAGGTRHYEIPISQARCLALKTLSVHVTTDAGQFEKTFTTVDKQCGSSSLH